MVQNQNYYKRAIVNERKRKSSLFRLRLKDLGPVGTGTAIPFFVECNQSEKQFKENLKRAKEATKESNITQSSFCIRWTQKRGPKPLNKLAGVANLQSSQKMFSRGCKQAETK